MANYCSERKGRKMPKIRFYHTKTLLWTYMVWAALSLLIAFRCCEPMGQQIFRHPIRNTNYWLAPYYWGLLHILPLYGLVRTFWECDLQGFIFFSPTIVAGFAIVAGLLIKGRWACFLIIIGMSLWFLGAFCLLGMGA